MRALTERLRSLQQRFAPAQTLKARFAGAVFWSFAAVAFSNFAGLVIAVILARVLGRETYGELGVIVSTYTLFSQLGGLGLGVTAVKYAAQLRSTAPQEVGGVLGTLMTVALASYATAAVAVALFSAELGNFLNRPSLAGPIALSSIVLFVQGIDSIQAGILAGFEAFRQAAWVTALRVFVNVPCTLYGAYEYGMWGVIWAMVISGAITLVFNRRAVNQVLAKNNVQIRYGIDAARLAPLWEFSLPAFLSATLTLASTWALNWLLVHRADGYAQMGIYNAANQWRAFAILIPGVFNSVVLSIQANLHATRDHQGHHRSVAGNLLVQGLVASLVTAVLVMGGPWIAAAYGEQYRATADLLAILACGWFFLTPNWIFWNAAISRGQVWWGLLINGFGTAALMILAVVLVEQGARGIAWALLYSGAFQVALQALHYWYGRRAPTLLPKTT